MELQVPPSYPHCFVLFVGCSLYLSKAYVKSSADTERQGTSRMVFCVSYVFRIRLVAASMRAGFLGGACREGWPRPAICNSQTGGAALTTPH
eukprot:scaffold536390_cov15-Prasinocladus_malaysianus.AAC.1